MFWFDLFSRFDTATRAAAVGGVTTLVNTDFLLFFCNPNCNLSCDHILLIIQVDMPLNALPPTTSPENLATKVKVNTFWRIWRTWAQTRQTSANSRWKHKGGCSPRSVLGGCGILGRSHPWQRSPSQGNAHVKEGFQAQKVSKNIQPIE